MALFADKQRLPLTIHARWGITYDSLRSHAPQAVDFTSCCMFRIELRTIYRLIHIFSSLLPFLIKIFIKILDIIQTEEMDL